MEHGKTVCKMFLVPLAAVLGLMAAVLSPMPKVFAASNVSSLSGLTISVGTLSPTFATGTKSYSDGVAAETAFVTVTPTKMNANSTIQVRINGGAYVSVTSGSPTGTLTLGASPSTNPIDVLVTAEDAITTTKYTITVVIGAPAAPTNVSAVGESNSTATVYWTAVPGAGSYTATSSPESITCTANAPAVSCGISTLTNGTSYTFTVTATNNTVASAASIASNSISMGNTGFATKSIINVQPAGAINGVAFSTQPVVLIVNANGRLFTNNSYVVVATITSGGGTLSGTTSLMSSSGVATFTDLVLTGAGASSTLTFTPGALVASTSAAFAVAPTSLQITTQPSGAVNGVAFTTQPVVRIVDPDMNTVSPVAAVAVAATIASGTGVLSGTMSVSVSAGIATFTNLVITGTVGNFTLTSTPTGLAGLSAVTSSSFALISVPGVPTIDSITPGNQSLSVAFTPGTNGNSAITDYKYSTDAGSTWRSAVTTSSPFTITIISDAAGTALVNGTSYNVQIRAVNAAGDGTATASTAARAGIYFTVTYNGNGATGGTVPVDGSSPYANGATVTVLGNSGSLVKTGYVFTNWNTVANGSGTSYSAGNTFAIGANTILYAQWAPVGKYTVAYNGNGSTGGTAPVDGSSPYASGATVTVLGNTGDLVRTGNTFANWNTAANGSGTSYSIGNTFTIAANITLFAQWSAVTFTVTYNGNGATGGTVPVDGSSPYLSGSTVTILGNTGSLANTGSTFANWNTEPDGSGTSYAPSATFTIGASIFLYAQWTTNSHTVAYNGNGSTGGTVPVDASNPYLNGATVSVLGNSGSLAKSGNTFADWNTAANGSGTSYSVGNTFAIGNETILYAQWSVVTPPVPPATSLPPIATMETPVTEVVRADATGHTVVDATILGIGGTRFVVSVTIPAGAISRGITITIAPATTPVQVSAGFIIIRVTATDSSETSVTQLDKPLIINLGRVNAAASVVFSQDEIAWAPIQLLSGTTLPDGMQEGYHVAANGDSIIVTRHLTYFGVKKTQVRLRVLSGAYILKVGESATLTAIGGSGSGVIGYVTTTPSICSVSDAGLVSALVSGVCIVEATKSGGATYANVLSLPLNLTIKKLVQAPFTLISSTDILSVGGSSTLTTSGGSGDGVIKFSTTTPTYCSVTDAGLVSALVSGNCIVEATKAGNDTYLEVASWPLYLTIERVRPVPALTLTPGTTVNGGVLPKTGAPWYNLLALGIGLILLGGVGWARRKRSS